MIIKGSEVVSKPLTKSGLGKKGLCDYVVNVAVGCLHSCKFCYVPSTPIIRMQSKKLSDRGVENPSKDWGSYLFYRQNVVSALKSQLESKIKWIDTPSGKGVVMLCSTTDPYQNKETTFLSDECVKLLVHHNKRIRILTRGLLWEDQIDYFAQHKNNITVGMSIPTFDDVACRRIETNAPPPAMRYNLLKKASDSGCRVYVAMAPTYPTADRDELKFILEKLLNLQPEVIFWEPINARGSNGLRLLSTGVEWANQVSSKKQWADNFIKQWDYLSVAADSLGCIDKIHVWPDKALKGFVDQERLNYWFDRPTIEVWS